jgi:hypothetical protein
MEENRASSNTGSDRGRRRGGHGDHLGALGKVLWGLRVVRFAVERKVTEAPGAELIPSVDFTKLEEVLVIKESTLPAWPSAPVREEKVKRVRKVPGEVPKKK